MLRSASSKQGLRNISPYEVVNLLSRNQITRERILKQLEQINLDVEQYQKLTLHQLLHQVQQIMNKTYSIKYLGLNKNQMGIISRRVDPQQPETDFKTNSIPDTPYTINQYFYPKPLKTGKRLHKYDHNINVNNLEQQIKRQFEENQAFNPAFHKTASNFHSTKKKLTGSWLCAEQIKAKKQINRGKTKQFGVQLPEKEEVAKSYSRFLKQGFLVMRN